MIRSILVTVAAALGVSLLSAKVEQADASRFAALAEESDVIVVDVRTPEEIAAGKIPNASELNFYDPEFAKKIAKLQKDKKILVYCRSGNRSGQAAQILEQLGYDNVVNLVGGIGAWKRANLDLVSPPASQSRAPAETIEPAAFDELVANSDRPVLLDFHTQWCSPCRRMKPVIDDLESNHADTISIVRIDADANEALAARFSVEAVPTFVLLRDGKETWRRTGIVDLDTFLEAAE